MKKSNRWLALLLAGMLLLTTACGTAPDKTNPDTTTPSTTDTPNKDAAPSTDSGTDSQSGTSQESNPYGLVYAEDQTLRTIYNVEASTLHPYTGDGSAGTWQAISNLTEGLQTVDQYGNFIPGLAESIEISEDELVYTYHLRQGLQWVDYKGNEMCELTADDFVTAAQFICDPANAASAVSYYDGIIAGATAILAGDTTDMSTLGYKALDKYTVEITLERQVPYFDGYGGHFLPMCTSLYEELGPSYGMDNESLYYIGPYRLTSFDPQSQRVYEKNYSYWDADNVHIEKVIATYNAEASTLAPELFNRGEIDQAKIGTSILSEWMTNPDTKDITIPGQPDGTYMYYYLFNYVPNFGDDAAKAKWIAAVDNENFRQSLYWGLDRVKAKMAQEPYNPELFLSNTITPVSWCSVDGVDFTEIEPLAEITHRENWGFDSSKALEYRDKAVEELTAQGITFPIEIYLPYDPSTQNLDMETQVVKQQLEELLGTDYITISIETGPSTGFLDAVRRAGNYGMLKSRNGAAEYDPEKWVIAFDRNNTWCFLDKATGPNVKALADEYLALLDAAKAITTNSMERYQAFAEAEAFLIGHALVIPVCADSTGYMVTKLNPLEGMHNTDGSFKYYHLLAEPLTVEQYDQIYADWLEARAASRK